MGNEIKVSFYGGYQGQPKCQAIIGDQEYVIELKDLAELLEEMIVEKGFTIAKTNRQKYPRLTINK